MSHSVAISVFSLGGWRKGRGGCVRNIGHEHDICQAQMAESTDPRTNCAVKYATARGHLKYGIVKKKLIFKIGSCNTRSGLQNIRVLAPLGMQALYTFEVPEKQGFEGHGSLPLISLNPCGRRQPEKTQVANTPENAGNRPFRKSWRGHPCRASR